MFNHCFYWLCTSTTSDGGVTTTSTWEISCCLCCWQNQGTQFIDKSFSKNIDKGFEK